MMSAREKILGNIRRSLDRDSDRSLDSGALRARTQAHARHLLPEFDEEPVYRFRQKMMAAHATVSEVNSLTQVALEITGYLNDHDLAPEIVISGEPLITQLSWPQDVIRVEQRLPRGSDTVSVTSALYGIAETGTLMLVSGEQSATSLNFLPDYHIVVLPVEQMVLRMEDAWDGLRERFPTMPRTVNFISGPSKTADVEQTVEYGAHGPRCLHVILLRS